MSCQEANNRFVEALNAYVRLEEELKPLLLSYVSTPGQSGDTIIPGSEKFERVTRLMEQRDAAYERYRAAEAAFFDAKRRHHD
jgi:hypothetical protein